MTASGSPGSWSTARDGRMDFRPSRTAGATPGATRALCRRNRPLGRTSAINGMKNRSARTPQLHEISAHTTAGLPRDRAAHCCRRPCCPRRVTRRPHTRLRHSHLGCPHHGQGPDRLPAGVRVHLPRDQLRRPALRQAGRRRIRPAPAGLHPEQGQLHHQQQQPDRQGLPKRQLHRPARLRRARRRDHRRPALLPAQRHHPLAEEQRHPLRRLTTAEGQPPRVRAAARPAPSIRQPARALPGLRAWSSPAL
ncbi:hypothetical protein SCOCK_690023 [Actinacidiphila cocklensis]|uniref:Uncharacterized protein n=1 Tax=Actinacidiphila cocklensis TaxID=887465 RepID=A0A9W4GVH4_9ACTN|nr:hypothetical protein SCOCK_690023 [Actinacidiphila cocklensis]